MIDEAKYRGVETRNNTRDVKRVLICRSNPVAPDPRVEKVAKALAGLGYSVSILGWDRTGALPPMEIIKFSSTTAEAGDDQANRQGQEGDSPSTILIRRLPIRSAYGHGLMNLPNLLRWQAGLLKALIVQQRDFDVIHACDFDTVLPALICQKIWAKKVVYDIFDFYADHLRATPALLKKMIRWLDIQAINRADGLILADEARFAQIAGSRPRLTAVIYNSPEQEPEAVQLAAPQDHTTGLRITYVGLLQVERGLLDMIAVLQKHPEWSLDLAGFGGDEARLLSLIASMPNVRWHGRVPYLTALELSRAADVLFATYDPAIPNHRYSSPNKVFEAMLLGKPIIVARHTNMDRIIQQADCGLVIDYGDRAGLEAALLQLQNDGTLRQRLGANGQRAYAEQYRWFNMVQRLAELYQIVAP